MLHSHFFSVLSSDLVGYRDLSWQSLTFRARNNAFLMNENFKERCLLAAISASVCDLVFFLYRFYCCFLLGFIFYEILIMIHGREILLSLCLMRVQNASCVCTFSLVGLGNFLLKFYGIN